MNIKKDKNGQISSELILLIGLTLIFVLIIGKFIFKLNNDINIKLKNLIEIGRNTTLNNL
ncbi:MAG: hypothetical protein ACI4RQ_03425 [Methanobrevibacter wolinii]|uniref:hypothetical protein n=1 Tax=Methanobrevibacter wolinii TaxID=190977 RepID=UPI0005B2B154|nr:hypothetical protein [Methanobrevibacter wolinii]MDD5959396.1 hypothetical protein [Methanobrevibacter wolinii]